ncbi:PP2C family protein-serine/threonine phosphatase [Cryptosporangium aurantiacum]|nr:SpoIIE family protein phosphatase [Cryptosporangium aurantiacum]
MSEEPADCTIRPLADVAVNPASYERAAFLADAGRQLAGGLGVDGLVRRALRACVPKVADWAQLVVPADRGARCVAADAETADRLSAVDVPRPTTTGALSGHARVIATGRPETVPVAPGPGFAESLAPWVPGADRDDRLARLRPMELAVLPLVARGTPFGTLTLARRAGQGFDTDELTFAGEVGARIAVALDSARVRAAQAEIADAMAATRRPPSLPETPGLELGVRHRPGSGHGDGGGDFYDVLGEPGDWVILHADVITTGAQAAVVTAQARHTVRGAVYFERRPAEILRALNAALAAPFPDDSARLLTAVCARVRTRRDGGLEVTLASAGHPRPVLIRRGDDPVELPVQGRLCGALATTTYEEIGTVLARGDLLLLFSNRVPDAKGSEGRFGLDRLTTLAARFAGAPPAALAEVVDLAVGEVMATRPGEHADDLGLVVLGAPLH